MTTIVYIYIYIYIYTAKFNCTVPGTLANFIEECNVIMSGSPQIAMTVKFTVTVNSARPTNHKINAPEFDIKIAIIIPVGLCFVFMIATILIITMLVPLYKKQQTNAVLCGCGIERSVDEQTVSVDQQLQNQSKTV